MVYEVINENGLLKSEEAFFGLQKTEYRKIIISITKYSACILFPYVSVIVVSVVLDLQLPSLVLDNFICFSNHRGAVFFFLLISLPLSILQCRYEKGNHLIVYKQEFKRLFNTFQCGSIILYHSVFLLQYQF